MPEFPKNPPIQADITVSSQGGVDSRTQPYLLRPEQLTDVENMILNRIGRLERRRGSTAIGGGGPPGPADGIPAGMGSFVTENFEENLIASFGSKLFRSAGTGQWDQVATGTSLINAHYHDFTRCRYQGVGAVAVSSAQDITDTSEGDFGGLSQVVIYNTASDTATQISLAPRALAFFQNRLFYGLGEQIGWSEIGDIASFSETNDLLVEPGTGGQITAIIAPRDLTPTLWIFKQDAIFQFDVRWGPAGTGALIPTTTTDELDTTNSAIRTIASGAGAIATRSVAWVPGQTGADIFFLARDGIRTISRAENDVTAGASFPLSFNIPGWIDRINFTAAHRACAAVFDNAYHIAIPLDGSTTNNFILRFDISNQAWSLHKLFARDLRTFSINEEPALYYQFFRQTKDSTVTGVPGSTGLYQIYRLFDGTYDPATDPSERPSVPFLFESRQFVAGEPMIRKKWDRLQMQFSSDDTAAIEVQYSLDAREYTTLTEMFLPGGGTPTVILAETPLPWSAEDDRIKKRSFSLKDLPPSYGIQIRVVGQTDQTDVGRPVFYMSRVEGTPLANEFEND